VSFELDRVKLTISERSLLSKLKSRTGIDNWNIFARWAFCYSIGKASEINLNEEDGEYGVEMSWVVFSGKNYKIYQDLLSQECGRFELEPTKTNLNKVLRAHLRNGVKQIFTQTKSLDDLFELTNVS
jgi:DNA sulfur modification protein DndE